MDNNRKLRVWLPLLFSITLIAGMVLGYRLRDRMPGKPFFSIDKANPLQEVMDLIRNKYVDQLPIGELQDTAIAALLAKLDPHSVYINAKEVESANEDIAGNFFGIGVEFSLIEDTINVMYVIPDGPSAKAGIMIGDKLLKANDSLLAGVKIDGDNIKRFLRGGLNSKVNIELLRGTTLKKIMVERGIIPVSSVDAAYMMEPGIGYLRLNKFSQVTYREFMQSLEKLKTAGMTKLIFDLRGNGGGVLDQAAEIADEFLEGDKLITYTEGKHFPKKEYRCKRQGLFEKGELVVLADEGTASASEIIIGALQDWDRATIVGRRSFGKGLVQEQYDLSDGSALRLTVARYFTPVGRSIQRPYANGGKAYYEEISNRFHDGEVYSQDSIHVDSSKRYKTQAGRLVFGGGGITPDVFVAMDSGSSGLTTARLYYKGTISDFAFQYYMQNKTALSAYKTPVDFSGRFMVSDTDWQTLSDMASRDSIRFIVAGKEKDDLALRIKASIARQVWRNEGFYEVMNTTDPVINKAIQVLKKGQ
jgi:carboxyl-terminal processing protease